MRAIAVGGPYDGQVVDWGGTRVEGPCASYANWRFTPPMWEYRPEVSTTLGVRQLWWVYHENPISLDELLWIGEEWDRRDGLRGQGSNLRRAG